MHAERTPNPNSIMWVVGAPLVEGDRSAHFDAPPSEDVSPLAARLFAIEGVSVVYLSSHFVTVTKRDEAEWSELAPAIADGIRACLGAGGPALGPAFEKRAAGGEGEVVARIRRILEQEVRPAVAMDGGDIAFAGYRDGVVELYLHGACSGCPSSEITLKSGIEARLRQEIPEIRGVVAL